MAPSPRQISFIESLIRDRQPDEHLRVEAQEVIDGDRDRRQASGIIERLLNAPRATTGEQQHERHENVRVTEPGVYRLDGEVYIVKPPRDAAKRAEGRLYAKQMVERPGIERLAEDGTPIYGVDFIYAPGAVYRLSPEDRMPFEDARALTARYARCIVCGAHLKAKQSVERGIGPVCRGYFPDAGVQAPVEPDERGEVLPSEHPVFASFSDEAKANLDRLVPSA